MKIGDVVTLASRMGPQMTVAEEMDSGKLCVVWFNEQLELHSAILPANALITTAPLPIRHGIDCQKYVHKTQSDNHPGGDEARIAQRDGSIVCGSCHEVIGDIVK